MSNLNDIFLSNERMTGLRVIVAARRIAMRLQFRNNLFADVENY